MAINYYDTVDEGHLTGGGTGKDLGLSPAQYLSDSAVLPYLQGLAEGDFQEHVKYAKSRYFSGNLNLLQAPINATEDSPFLKNVPNFYKQVLQVARSRQLAEFNDHLSQSRGLLQQQYELFNQQMSAAYSSGSPSPDAQNQLNNKIWKAGQSIIKQQLQYISDPDMQNAYIEQFNHELGLARRNLTLKNIGNEVNYYRASYDSQANGLEKILAIAPSMQYKDIINQYNTSLAAGVNMGLLPAAEAQQKSAEFSQRIKGKKVEQLKADTQPSPTLTAGENYSNAIKLVSESIKEGVLTPGEGQQIIAEAKSQALNSTQIQQIVNQKTTVQQYAGIQAQAQQQEFKKAKIINDLSRGVEPSISDLGQLYSQTLPAQRAKLDSEIQSAFIKAKFAVLPNQLRKELLDNPEVLANTLGLTDAEQLKSLTTLNEKLVASESSDPVQSVMGKGLVSQVVPIDYSNPDGLVTSLRNRSQLSDMVYAQTNQSNVGLTANEISDLGKVYTNASSKQKSEILGSIFSAYGEDKSLELFRQLSKEGFKGMALVGKYYAKGNTKTALDILNGQDILSKSKGNSANLNSAFEAVVSKYELPTFLDDASSGTSRQELFQAAKAIAVSKLAKGGHVYVGDKDENFNVPTERFNTEDQGILAESLQDALGLTSGGGSRTGGFLGFNTTEQLGIKLGSGIIDAPFEGATESTVLGAVGRIKMSDLPVSASWDTPYKDEESFHKFLSEDALWISNGDGTYLIARKLPPALKDYFPNSAGLTDVSLMYDLEGNPITINLKKYAQETSYIDLNKVPSVLPQYTSVLDSLAATGQFASSMKQLMDDQDASILADTIERLKRGENIGEVQQPWTFDSQPGSTPPKGGGTWQ